MAISKMKVLKRQFNSKQCIVCGTENKSGLHTAFYELENGEIAAVFTPHDQHQSYPDRLHGGMSAAILDETIGRAITVGKNDIVWGMTIELNLKYRKPVPLGVELIVVGRITNGIDKRIFEGTGELYLPDGSVAVEARGRYIKVPLDSIVGDEFDNDSWRVDIEDDVKEI
jgi:uncharacterized protein (TIGR00369 family)